MKVYSISLSTKQTKAHLKAIPNWSQKVQAYLACHLGTFRPRISERLKMWTKCWQCHGFRKSTRMPVSTVFAFVLKIPFMRSASSRTNARIISHEHGSHDCNGLYDWVKITEMLVLRTI